MQQIFNPLLIPVQRYAIFNSYEPCIQDFYVYSSLVYYILNIMVTV